MPVKITGSDRTVRSESMVDHPANAAMKIFSPKKLVGRILVGIFAIVLVSQVPFLINRWQTGRLASRIERLSKNKAAVNAGEYRNYKGIIHTHSFLGGHSTGTFDELIAASAANDLDFVVMTEHTTDSYDTSAMTLRGLHNNTLYIGGSEIGLKDGNRMLVLDGFPGLAGLSKLNTSDFLREVHKRNRIAFVTYPERFTGWEADVDGSEVFSLYTNAKGMNRLTFLFDMIWSYRGYPGLTVAKYFRRPDSGLESYDNFAKTRRLTLFAGSDAHSNLGLHIGDDSNNKYINLKLDRYQTIFRLVRTHVMIPDGERIDRDSLLKALKAGNSYIGFDVLGDSDGFMFSAVKDGEQYLMGNEVVLEDEIELIATAPKTSRFIILKNGEKIFESGQTTKIHYTANQKGAYRVEVYQDILGSPFDRMPWIISNPVYIR